MLIESATGTLRIHDYDPATGIAVWDYELTTNISHSDGVPDSDVFTLTTTDQAGETSAPATITIAIGDDAPQVDTTGETPSLLVDETVLATDDSADFSDAFASFAGADGASLSYSLGIAGGDGTDSGLVDVATGQSIVLFLNGGVVEGHVGSADGALAFTLTLEGSTVTVDQLRAMEHPDSAEHC